MGNLFGYQPGGFGGGGLIEGTVDNFAALPAASSYAGKMFYVLNDSGGSWVSGLFGSYQYPKGLYISDGTDWNLSQIQVAVSEDAETLVNINDWTAFLSTGVSFNTGDRLIYNRIQYENLTGSSTSTAPDTDAANWGIIGNIDESKRYTFMMCG